MVDFGYMGIDGQKIHANAALRQSKTSKGIKKELIKIEEIMEELLQKDARDDDDLKKIGKLEYRKSKITERLKELEKLMEEEKNEKNRNLMRINITDKDASVMTQKDGSKKPSYLTLACTDSKYQIVTAYGCKGYFNESDETIPLINASKDICGQYHKKVGLDSNFSSLENLRLLEKYPIDLYMPDRGFDKWKKDDEKMRFHKCKFTFSEDGQTLLCPLGNKMKLKSTNNYDNFVRWRYKGSNCQSCVEKTKCTKDKCRTVTFDSRDYLQTNMREKLKSKNGKKEYQKRMHTIEPIFGDLQKNKKWNQFHLRGDNKAKGEFGLHMIALNLKKILLHNNELDIDLKTAMNNMKMKYSLQMA